MGVAIYIYSSKAVFRFLQHHCKVMNAHASAASIVARERALADLSNAMEEANANRWACIGGLSAALAAGCRPGSPELSLPTAFHETPPAGALVATSETVIPSAQPSPPEPHLPTPISHPSQQDDDEWEVAVMFFFAVSRFLKVRNILVRPGGMRDPVFSALTCTPTLR